MVQQAKAELRKQGTRGSYPFTKRFGHALFDVLARAGAELLTPAPAEDGSSFSVNGRTWPVFMAALREQPRARIHVSTFPFQ